MTRSQLSRASARHRLARRQADRLRRLLRCIDDSGPEYRRRGYQHRTTDKSSTLGRNVPLTTASPTSPTSAAPSSRQSRFSRGSGSLPGRRMENRHSAWPSGRKREACRPPRGELAEPRSDAGHRQRHRCSRYWLGRQFQPCGLRQQWCPLPRPGAPPHQTLAPVSF